MSVRYCTRFSDDSEMTKSSVCMYHIIIQAETFLNTDKTSSDGNGFQCFPAIIL